MINLLLRLAYYACSATDEGRKNNLPLKVWYAVIKRFSMAAITVYLKVYYSLTKRPIVPLDSNGGGPILSLTSFPARIKNLWIVLDSFYRQTLRPSKIVLVLTREEFPKGMEEIPNSLKRLLNKGLEIVFVDYNLRPHNKYYYALSTYKDCDVVTLDDDLYYWQDTIERLYELKRNHPGCICANRAMLQTEKDGKVLFSGVHLKEGYRKGMNLMAQGVGGVLYLPEFRSEEMFKQETIRELSIRNDDNWLRIQETLMDIPVVTGRNYPHPLILLSSQGVALWRTNVCENNGSTMCTRRLLDYYHLHLTETSN
jgi:hypothetical protein